jgi:hypothetical protein
MDKVLSRAIGDIVRKFGELTFLLVLLMSSTNARTRMMEIDELIRIMSRLRIAIWFVWLGDTLNDWFEWQ